MPSAKRERGLSPTPLQPISPRRLRTRNVNIKRQTEPSPHKKIKVKGEDRKENIGLPAGLPQANKRLLSDTTETPAHSLDLIPSQAQVAKQEMDGSPPRKLNATDIPAQSLDLIPSQAQAAKQEMEGSPPRKLNVDSQKGSSVPIVSSLAEAAPPQPTLPLVVETIDLSVEEDRHEDDLAFQPLRTPLPSTDVKDEVKEDTIQEDLNMAIILPAVRQHGEDHLRETLALIGQANTSRSCRQKSPGSEELNPEDEAINDAYADVDRSAIGDLNAAETDWMDELIHNRLSADVSRTPIDLARRSELSREELMAYLVSIDNRPGRVKRRRKIVEKTEAASVSQPQHGTSSDETALILASTAPNLQDSALDDHMVDSDGERADESRIREEREHVIQAARSLRCKQRRQKITRRELIQDADGSSADAVSTSESPADDHAAEELNRIVIAEAPDGRPRRYRLLQEVKKTWIVRGMETALLDHQILGVDWMVNEKEVSDRPPRGGLLCDQMGLGKTMQVIATMVLNRPPVDIGYKGPKVTLIITPAALMQQWKQEIETHTSPGTFTVTLHHGQQKIKSLAQLKAKDVVITSYHTVMFSHPSPKRPRLNMTNEEVEIWWENEWEKRGIFHRMKFWRICIDESHWIKNHRSRISAACTSLRAVHKWSISGTPIQNSLQDMYAQFRFLDHLRFGDLPSFRSVFGTSMSGGAARATKAMQVELSRIMMRRTKDEKLCGRKLLDLTPKDITTTEVEFGPEERELYQCFEKKTILEVNRLRRSGGGTDFFLAAIALLMRLRQICDSPFLVLGAIKKHMTVDELKEVLRESARQHEEQEGDDELPASVTNAFGTPRKRQKTGKESNGLRQILELAKAEAAGDSTQCVICLDVPEDPVLTNCRHCFCQGCITTVIQNADMQAVPSLCPYCKQPIRIDDLRAYVEGFGAERPDTDGEVLSSDASLDNTQWLNQAKTAVPSAKMAALKAQLRCWKETRPDDKIIVFSQFTKMLDLVWLMCEKQGWETTRYQGGTSMKTREESLKRFKTDPDCWIMLTSLRAGGVGLNLTEANLVVSIDMWWNAAVEHQAFDRVHRLGQSKDVFVIRLMVKKTVEERILALQKAKLMIVDAAMGEGLGRVKNLSIKELMGLFGKVVMGDDGIEMVVQID